MKKRTIVLSTALALSLSSFIFADGASLTADFSATKTPVSKNLYGIFYEDINYAADGGIYGEMIQNRSFEFRKSRRQPTDTWENVNISGEKSSSRVKGTTKVPLNQNNVTYATLTVKANGDGIGNKGYNGIPFEKGKKYPGSIYLRSNDGSISSVTIRAEQVSGKKRTSVYETKISGITKEWKKFTFDVIPNANAMNGMLSIYADCPNAAEKNGTLDIDFVSLFRADIYKNQENGLRKDLVEMLEAMKPKFIRFPGGCIVHGMSLQDRYEWKDTVGPVEQRKEKFNFWGYQQSYGLGFFEYFRLCEDLNAEPIPVLSCGMAHGGERSPTSEYMAYAQDALDMIEWATGPATSKWGKIRAEAGHPEPFKLNYIGIGNEDCGGDYFARFKFISEVIKKKYPNIKTIISSGFTWNDTNFHNTWNQVKAWEKSKKGNDKNLCDLVDEHYYNESNWFLGNGHRYDNLDFYSRDPSVPKVFIGEYASWVEGKRNNLEAALTEAAYMTSIERNGDVVELAAYAPLFARIGNVQWFPDAIWFNNTEVYGTPNYYVQKMFMNNQTDKTIKSELVQPKTNEKKNVIGGTIGLGTWLTTAQFRDIKFTNADTKAVVYESTKSSSIDDFRLETGDWSKKGPVIYQNSQMANVRAVLDNELEIGDIENYDFEVKATKTSGQEGFLIMFGVKGQKLYWWNLGGWGNTQSCIEKGTADGRSIQGESKAINLATGKTYNIKIEVRGESYKCYLDGQLMHEFTDSTNFDPLYAHIGETEDKVIVKIVNITNNAQKIDIDLKGAPAFNPKAQATILSGSPADENSITYKDCVIPKTESFTVNASKFDYTVKANSVTILELQKK